MAKELQTALNLTHEWTKHCMDRYSDLTDVRYRTHVWVRHGVDIAKAYLAVHADDQGGCPEMCPLVKEFVEKFSTGIPELSEELERKWHWDIPELEALTNYWITEKITFLALLKCIRATRSCPGADKCFYECELDSLLSQIESLYRDYEHLLKVIDTHGKTKETA